MKNEELTNAQPAIIRAFFASFAEGILSDNAEKQGGTVEVTPRIVKQVMLEHYEEISKNFFDIMFYPLALLHYGTAEELIGILRSPEIAPTIKSSQDLFRHACRTKEAHEDMVTEYRRNFASLLAGKVMSIDDFYGGFPEGYLQDSNEHKAKEVRALTQVVVKGFFAGRKTAKAECSAGSNQVYLFRLLLDSMQTLLHSRPVDMDDDIDLNAAFMLVCRNEQNLSTMLQAMEENFLNE
ncbi:MAG: hypothetical protein ACI4T5_09065, partial [Prevotella sp.]